MMYRISTRSFSTTSRTLSHIGTAPILVPDTVTLALDVPNSDQTRQTTPLIVTGPKGRLSVDVPMFARLMLDKSGESPKLQVNVVDAGVKEQRSMWGTLRSAIQNHITGVSEGHIATIQFVGTGYRAEMVGPRKISVKFGQTGTTVFDVPEGMSALSPIPTQLVLEGIDKCVVGQFAANIRALKPPEPYKGKGIFVNNETIKMKDKKVK
ncbi:ribosomal protein L6, alpha-beta domain-containing protein [Lipomyces arxii]|uniref:mitochondrial 54S ribosomal protein uL6m n=1 Tax=Lipomyces arxii TaxID=56418 RepID=UPI0034CE9DDA